MPIFDLDRLRKHVPKLSLKSLIGIALQETDLEESHIYWLIVHELQFRATPQTLQATQTLFHSKNWRKRVLAINIISQMLLPTQPYQPYAVKEAQEILLTALHDIHPAVILAAIYGLGHRATVEALPDLLTFSKHKDAKYRHAVTFALTSYDNDSAIETLLVLATDPDDNVRDWATFALGSLHDEIDTPNLRERLWLNCSDENLIISGEALVGLAKRKDRRVYDLVLKRLEICEPTDFFIQEAVQEMDCPALYKVLEEQQQK